MNKLKFKGLGDTALVKTVEWMLGYPGQQQPNNWRFSNWSKSRRRLASPLSHYLGEIERFSLDRGYRLDLPNVPAEDPRQKLLCEVMERNYASELQYASFERGAITGAVYWAFRPDAERYYRLYLYDGGEVCPYPEDSGLNGFMVQVEGPQKTHRYGFTDQAYLGYKTTRNPASEWELESETPHPYGFVPMVKILNKVGDHTHRGQPTFDWVAVEMAMEICAQTLSSAANYTYFGGPFLISSDPKATLTELLNRSQVLTGRTSAELQDTGLLSMPAMPDSHKTFVDGLGKALADHLRISWVADTPPGDTSSLTLRLLFSKTVNTAQKLGDKYLGGFKELMGLVLLAAAYDGLVVGVTPTSPETHELKGNFEHEIFPMTPGEKQQVLAVVEQLQALGVSSEVALKEYYTGLNEDQIKEILIGA